jgi:hypothetical protein
VPISLNRLFIHSPYLCIANSCLGNVVHEGTTRGLLSTDAPQDSSKVLLQKEGN